MKASYLTLVRHLDTGTALQGGLAYRAQIGTMHRNMLRALPAAGCHARGSGLPADGCGLCRDLIFKRLILFPLFQTGDAIEVRIGPEKASGGAF